MHLIRYDLIPLVLGTAPLKDGSALLAYGMHLIKLQLDFNGIRDCVIKRLERFISFCVYLTKIQSNFKGIKVPAHSVTNSTWIYGVA